MSFETVALAVLLAAQIYRIIRSEVLLSRERGLHQRIEEHLSSMTPEGMWPQYEALKKFHAEAVDQVKDLTADLEMTKSRMIKTESRSPSDSEQVRLLQDNQFTVSQALQTAIAKLENLSQLSEQFLEFTETKKKLGRLESQFKRRVEPRGFSVDVDPRMWEILERGPKGTVEILYQAEDGEAYNFAHQLKMNLRMCHWQVLEPTTFPPSKDGRPAALVAGANDSDLTILASVLESDRDKSPAETPYQALCGGLKAGGIGLHMSLRPELPPNHFKLLVGPKGGPGIL
jgi:hypothetical protein